MNAPNPALLYKRKLTAAPASAPDHETPRNSLANPANTNVTEAATMEPCKLDGAMY
jgi:hypothetical protein